MKRQQASGGRAQVPRRRGLAAHPRRGRDSPWRADRRDCRRPPWLRVGPRRGGRLRAGTFPGRDSEEARTVAGAVAHRSPGRRRRPGGISQAVPRTAADLARLARWLGERGVRLVLIEGNHDRSLAWMAREKGFGAVTAAPVLQSQLLVAGWTIAHGHRLVPAEPSDLGPSSSRAAGFRPLGPLLPGGRRADHPARLLGQCRGAGRRIGPAAGRLGAKLPALSCQYGKRPAGLRSPEDAPCPAGMIVRGRVSTKSSAAFLAVGSLTGPLTRSNL